MRDLHLRHTLTTLSRDAAETLTRWQGTRCFMAMSDGHCAALVIDAGSGRFSCSVYADRPDTCRELERGSGVHHARGERCAADHGRARMQHR